MADIWEELDDLSLETVDGGLFGDAGTYHSDVTIETTTTLPGYDQPSQTTETIETTEQTDTAGQQQEAQEEWQPGQQNDGDVAYNYLMGIGTDEAASWSPNGYARTYSYSGGSSSSGYMPKIYSNSRSLSSNRAATMYSKQPRDASYSYLRPSFETNGSRSAYER